MHMTVVDMHSVTESYNYCLWNHTCIDNFEGKNFPKMTYSQLYTETGTTNKLVTSCSFYY